MDKPITCNEFEKLIPSFISQKLEYRTLSRFCKHAHSCSECHEELNIQFLVSEGMVRLEEGDAFDLNLELDKRLLEAERKISRHDRCLYFGQGVEWIAMAGILGMVFWILLR